MPAASLMIRSSASGAGLCSTGGVLTWLAMPSAAVQLPQTRTRSYSSAGGSSATPPAHRLGAAQSQSMGFPLTAIVSTVESHGHGRIVVRCAAPRRPLGESAAVSGSCWRGDSVHGISAWRKSDEDGGALAGPTFCHTGVTCCSLSGFGVHPLRAQALLHSPMSNCLSRLIKGRHI